VRSTASRDPGSAATVGRLSDLEPPVVPAAVALSGSPVPPQQRLYFYSSDEWEDFIREWATGLVPGYMQIKRLGGPNDRGVDVAAFKTARGFEGAWDCFQGKHYAGALTLSDVLPEMLKVFVNVVGGAYTLPDSYAFLAPRGCGPTLNRLLSRPTEFREQFLAKISAGSDLVASLDPAVVAEVRGLAAATDFSLFRSVEVLDALEVHRQTAYFVARFGGPLSPRPEGETPPPEIADHEARYVAQLVQVYEERFPSEQFSDGQLSGNPTVGKHFQRQRFAFYSAESLRLYARDSVPEGTFEALQDDIHAGVIEVAESDHHNGMARLAQVLTASGQLDLSSHTLISVSNMNDRKGICHQLANEDRLDWMGPQP
jgi:hypothetical protein